MNRTYGNLALKPAGHHWEMSNIAPHVSMRLKQIFPRISKVETENFTFPNDKTHCAELMWFMSRYPMVMDAKDRRKLKKGMKAFERDQDQMEHILSADYQSRSSAMLKDGQEIRWYQAQAVDLLCVRKSMLLSDDLGLGKTYTAAAFLISLAAKPLPAAIVVQGHLQTQWKEKIEAFTTLRVHLIETTKPYKLPEADAYIFRYSNVRGWIDFFKQAPFRTAIFDECQEIRCGTASDKGAACIELAKHCEYRLGLSATPIYNYGAEIWNVMQAIDPTVLGDWAEFVREWLTDDRVVRDPDALGTYLREQHILLRRTKKMVGQNMDAVNPIIEHVEADEDEIKNIEERARSLAIRTVSGAFVERGAAARELDLLMRQATGIAKARSVAAFVRILLEAKIPVLLGGWHREVYRIWNRDLAEFKPAMYTGTESNKQKDESKRKFLSGETDLLIMSIRSGAGLDGLQERCSYAILGEIDWSPKVHEQFIGRLDREGQKEQVTAVYLLCDEGSDPPMVDILGLKSAQSKGIVDPGVVLAPVARDRSRIKALAATYLSKKEMTAFEQIDANAEDAIFAADPANSDLAAVA